MERETDTQRFPANRRTRRPARLLVACSAAAAALALVPAASEAKAHDAAYHDIPLSKFVKTPGGSFQVLDHFFAWSLSGSPGMIDGKATSSQILLRGTRHHCRSMSLRFVPGRYSAYLTVHQRGQKAVSAITPTDVVDTLTVPLKPNRTFNLIGATPATSSLVYIDGTLNCTTSAGSFSQPQLAKVR